MNGTSLRSRRGGGRCASTLAACAVAAMMVAPLAIVGWHGMEPAGQTRAAAVQPDSGDGVARTEAGAKAEAAASGQPVEVLAFRGEQRDVTANPDGTMTAREYAAPVRTLENGSWTELDPTLAEREDGRLAPAAATVAVSFSGGGDDPLVRVAKAGRSMSLGWSGQLPTPTVDGATATYAEVLPGVDLRVTALADGFSHTLVVSSADAAARVAEVTLPLTRDGTQVRTTDAGGTSTSYRRSMRICSTPTTASPTSGVAEARSRSSCRPSSG